MARSSQDGTRAPLAEAAPSNGPAAGGLPPMTTAQPAGETAAAGGPEHRASDDQRQSDSGERHSLAALALLPSGNSGDPATATATGNSGGTRQMPDAELAVDDI